MGGVRVALPSIPSRREGKWGFVALGARDRERAVTLVFIPFFSQLA